MFAGNAQWHRQRHALTASLIDERDRAWAEYGHGNPPLQWMSACMGGTVSSCAREWPCLMAAKITMRVSQAQLESFVFEGIQFDSPLQKALRAVEDTVLAKNLANGAQGSSRAA